ncbi:MAG: hypothetical protein ACOC3Z_03335, partial [Nanoarchaeota archaeon]
MKYKGVKMKPVTLFDFIKKTAAELDSGETGLLKSDEIKGFLSKQKTVYSDDIIKFLWKTENENVNSIREDSKEDTRIENCIDEIIKHYDYNKFSTRLDDYKLAIDSTETIEYAKRAHFVLKSEILSPDASDKKTLLVNRNPTSNLNEDELNVLVDRVETIINDLNIESALNDNIVDRSILYGECYVEICNADEELKKSLGHSEEGNFLEGFDIEFSNKEYNFQTETVSLKYKQLKEYIKEKINLKYKEKENSKFMESLEEKVLDDNSLNINFTVSDKIKHDGLFIENLETKKTYRMKNKTKKIISFLEEKLDFGNVIEHENNNFKQNKLKELYLRFHEPYKVIPIKTNQFLIGYLVFPDQPSIRSFNNSTNTKNQSNPISTNPLGNNSSEFINNPMTNLSQLLDDNSLPGPLQNFIDKYINVLKKNLGNINIPKNLKSTLAQMITQRVRSLKNNHTIDSYFVSIDNMQQFKIMDDEDDPFFGQSIFKKSKHKLKLLVLIQAAIAINRLTASQDMTTLALEVGHLRKIKNVMNRVKDVFLRTRKTLDDFDSIDSITSGVATTNILTVPQKDGKRFIDFEKSNTKNDVRDYIDDYKMLRDEYVAGLYVPPSHLGLEENIDARATVSKQNILFATAILTYQKLLGTCMNSLIFKIYSKLNSDFNYYDHIKVQYPEPTSLLLESTNEIIDKVRNMVDTFKNLNVPESKILEIIRKYLPHQFNENFDLEEIADSIKSFVQKDDSSGDSGDMGG